MSNLLALAIAVPLFIVAVVFAVSSYRNSGARVGTYTRFVFRALPYAVVIVAALYFARGGEDWAMIALELAFYIVLTWIIVCAVRKQWAKN